MLILRVKQDDHVNIFSKSLLVGRIYNYGFDENGAAKIGFDCPMLKVLRSKFEGVQHDEENK